MKEKQIKVTLFFQYWEDCVTIIKIKNGVNYLNHFIVKNRLLPTDVISYLNHDSNFKDGVSFVKGALK